MRIKTISALAPFGVVAVFAFFLLFIHFSTWFIWELLPPGDIRIAVNQTRPATRFFTNYLATTQLGSTLEKLESVRRFSISKSSDTTTVVIVPGNPFLFRDHKTLTERLNNAGFHTQHHGLLIVARQNNGTGDIILPGFYQTLRQATRRLFTSALPARPFFVASIKSGVIPFLEDPLTVLGTTDGNSIQLVATEPTMSFRSVPYNISHPTQQENELIVAIPSHMLSALPDELRQKWNNLLISNLGLIHTRPDIISILSQYNSPVLVKLSQNSAVIAVTKMQESFSDTIKKWVQAEESYTRQRQKAFRLPDGSLGYELAPGDAREVFINSTGSDNCRQDSYPRSAENSSEGDPFFAHHLWLCVSNSIAAFGSDENATKKISRDSFPADGSWYVFIGARYLANLPLMEIKSIFAAGTDTQVVIHLQLRDTL